MSKPWTVLLMLPSDWRSQQNCAADEICRLHVEAEGPEEAMEAAFASLESAAGYDVVAIYSGHLFDVFQP